MKMRMMTTTITMRKNLRNYLIKMMKIRVNLHRTKVKAQYK